MKKLMAALLAVVMIGIPFEMALGGTSRFTRTRRTTRSVTQYSKKKISAARARAAKKEATPATERTRAALREAMAKRIAAAKKIVARRRLAAAAAAKK